MVTNNHCGVSNMNFTIVDGNDNYLDKAEEFSKLYNNKKIRIADLKKRLEINTCTYNKLLRYCKETNLITPRRKPYRKKPTYKTHPRHYSAVRYRDTFYWAVKYKGKHYCNCKPREEAAYIVDKLRECDWDKTQLEKIRSDYRKCQ